MDSPFAILVISTWPSVCPVSCAFGGAATYHGRLLLERQATGQRNRLRAVPDIGQAARNQSGP